MTPRLTARWVLAAALLLGLPGAQAFAAGTDAASRIAARLDAATAAEITKLLRTASDSGVPEEPLVSVALEGAGRRAAPERIVQAVRRHLSALLQARRALGARASGAELGAAASALLTGVPVDTLAALRRARPGGSLVVPLVVLADFLARDVPMPVAVPAVRRAVFAGASDEGLMKLRERVESDLRLGVAPSAAVSARSEALVLWLRSGGDGPVRRAVSGGVPSRPGGSKP